MTTLVSETLCDMNIDVRETYFGPAWDLGTYKL